MGWCSNSYRALACLVISLSLCLILPLVLAFALVVFLVRSVVV